MLGHVSQMAYIKQINNGPLDFVDPTLRAVSQYYLETGAIQGLLRQYM